MKYKTNTRKSLLSKIRRLEQLTLIDNEPTPVLGIKQLNALSQDHQGHEFLSNMISVCQPCLYTTDILTKLTECLNEKSILKYNLINLKDNLISKYLMLSSEAQQKCPSQLEKAQRKFAIDNCEVPVHPLIKKGGRIPSAAKLYLEFIYNINRHPDSNLKKSIALKTKLSLDTVRIWFNNKRQRTKVKE